MIPRGLVACKSIALNPVRVDFYSMEANAKAIPLTDAFLRYLALTDSMTIFFLSHSLSLPANESKYVPCLLFAYPRCVLCCVANNDIHSDIC